MQTFSSLFLSCIRLFRNQHGGCGDASGLLQTSTARPHLGSGQDYTQPPERSSCWITVASRIWPRGASVTFLVAVIKHHGQNNLWAKGFILHGGFRGRVCNSGGGVTTGSWSRRDITSSNTKMRWGVWAAGRDLLDLTLTLSLTSNPLVHLSSMLNSAAAAAAAAT